MSLMIFILTLQGSFTDWSTSSSSREPPLMYWKEA
jgi:hypothetical protein